MKIVKEHINEKFVQDSDSIEDMGIGIKTAIKNSAKEIIRINWKESGELVINEIELWTLGVLIKIRKNEVVNWPKKNLIKYFKYIFEETGFNEYVEINSYKYSQGMVCILSYRFKEKYQGIYDNTGTIIKNI